MLTHGNELNTNITCECNIYVPPLVQFRQKPNVQRIGGELVGRNMSGDEIVDWACHSLLEVHTGLLFDHNGVQQDLRGDVAVFERYLRNEDLKSCANRIKRYAIEPRQRRMRLDAIDTYTLFDWVIKIDACATLGPCSELTISNLSLCAKSASKGAENLPSSPSSEPAEGQNDE